MNIGRDELELINLIDDLTLFGEFVLAKHLNVFRPRRINAFTTKSCTDIEDILKKHDRIVYTNHDDDKVIVYTIYFKHDVNSLLPYLCLYTSNDPSNPFLHRDVREYVFDNPFDCLRCCMYYAEQEKPLIVYEEDFERVMKTKCQDISTFTENEKEYLEQYARRIKDCYCIETTVHLIKGNVFDSDQDLQTF